MFFVRSRMDNKVSYNTCRGVVEINPNTITCVDELLATPKDLKDCYGDRIDIISREFAVPSNTEEVSEEANNVEVLEENNVEVLEENNVEVSEENNVEENKEANNEEVKTEEALKDTTEKKVAPKKVQSKTKTNKSKNSNKKSNKK